MRQSNIELLRIIAMIMIVAHHIAVHSGFDFPMETITVNRLWIQFLEIGGKIGVNVFVLISGYFLVTAPAIRIEKLLKLWLQIFTYSICIFGIFTVLDIVPFGIKEFVKHIFPITFSEWWFVSTYVVLYLISPYVNQLLNALEQRAYQRMLALLFVCWCLIPTFCAQPLQSNSLLWFIYLYSLAGYIRMYGKSTGISGGKYILLAVVLILLTFLSAVVFDLLGTRIPFFGAHAAFFYDMQRLPVVLISVCLFLGFRKINLRYHKGINLFATAAFGVYLIHDNPYVRPVLWETIFKNNAFSQSPFLIAYTLLELCVVYLVCTIIELCRIYVVEKRYWKAVCQMADVINKGIEQIFE